MDRIDFRIIRPLISSNKSYWEILKATNCSIINLNKAISRLLKKRVIQYKNNLFILKDKSFRKKLKSDFKKEYKLFCNIRKKSPEPKLDFFQGQIEEKYLLDRLNKIYNYGDLYDKKIFILGDDDIFSVLIALTSMAKKVYVAEIDERIINLIKDAKKKYRLNIEIREYNISQKLPKNLHNRFDVFITDFMETELALKACFSRAAQLLKKGSSVYFGLSELEMPKLGWHKFQKMIIKMNFVITDIIRDHSFYPDAYNEDMSYYHSLRLFKESPITLDVPDIVWYKSAFYRIEAIDKPKPIVKGDIRFSKKFYSDRYKMTIS